MAEHAELIENAFVNYLKAINPYPFSADLLIFPGENNLDKNDARIVAYIEGGDLRQEDPPLSGNRMTSVDVQLRTPFSKLAPAEKAKGVQEPLDQHKSNAAALSTAMLSASLPDDLTSSQAGFTCMGIFSRTPKREQQDNAWVSSWTIGIYSCPSALAA